MYTKVGVLTLHQILNSYILYSGIWPASLDSAYIYIYIYIYIIQEYLMVTSQTRAYINMGCLLHRLYLCYK